MPPVTHVEETCTNNSYTDDGVKSQTSITSIEITNHVTWCFSDRASGIDYMLITNFCALIIIYS